MVRGVRPGLRGEGFTANPPPMGVGGLVQDFSGSEGGVAGGPLVPQSPATPSRIAAWAIPRQEQPPATPAAAPPGPQVPYRNPRSKEGYPTPPSWGGTPFPPDNNPMGNQASKIGIITGQEKPREISLPGIYILK